MTAVGAIEDVLATDLGGALVRAREGWRWSDGMPELRVRDAFCRERAPAFEPLRVATGSGQAVQVPRIWRSIRFWPNGVLDESVVAAIQLLVRDAGPAVELSPKCTPAMDEYGLEVMGWLIDMGAWNDVMGAICGADWAAVHDTDLRERARRVMISSI